MYVTAAGRRHRLHVKMPSVFLVLLTASGCASVETQVLERVSDRTGVVRSETTRHPDSDLVRLSACVCDERITISAMTLQSCRKSEQQHVAVERNVIRTVPALQYEALSAGLLVGSGSVLAWQSAPGCSDSKPPSCQGSTPLYTLSLTAIMAGLGLGVSAVVDAFRAQDSTEHVQRLERLERIEWCGQAPAAGRSVAVRTRLEATVVSGRLDDSGVVELRIPRLPDAPAGRSVSVSLDGARFLPVIVQQCCRVESRLRD